MCPHQQVPEKALKRQEQLAVCHPILHLSLQRGNHCLVPQTQYCLGMHVTLTKNRGAAPPSAPCLDGASGGGHAMTWQSWPHQSHSDGPGTAILFYRRHSLGEGLSLGEACCFYTYRCWYLGW